MIRPTRSKGGLVRRPHAALAVALLAAAAASTTPAATATAGPPRTATPVASSPGTLFSRTQFQPTGYPGTTAWRITYRSTSATGRPNVVSGTVIAPAPGATPARLPTPIVAYAPGTLGMADRCAESRNLGTAADMERTYIEKYTALGYAVAITDYEGLGTPGVHTYNVGRSEGHAVLDVVRAAQRLPGSNLSPAAPVGVVGYSQGGFAAGWAVQLAPTYAPEINLKGASIGAPPGDLPANLAYLDGAEWAGLEFAAIIGVDAAYPNLHLERYLNAKGRAMVREVADQCVDQLGTGADGKLSKWAGHRLSEYTTSDFLNRADWRAAVRKSVLGTMTPRVPVLLYASPTDDIVPYAPTARLRDTWRRHGADVTFYAPDTDTTRYSHGLAGLYMAGVATGWISARLLGLPPSS